jgi:hypothetical protein
MSPPTRLGLYASRVGAAVGPEARRRLLDRAQKDGDGAVVERMGELDRGLHPLEPVLAERYRPQHR